MVTFAKKANRVYMPPHQVYETDDLWGGRAQATPRGGGAGLGATPTAYTSTRSVRV